MNITRIDIPNSIHKFKQFYTTLSNAYVFHMESPKDRTNPEDVVFISMKLEKLIPILN
jgi:hypothetical protein